MGHIDFNISRKRGVGCTRPPSVYPGLGYTRDPGNTRGPRVGPRLYPGVCRKTEKFLSYAWRRPEGPAPGSRIAPDRALFDFVSASILLFPLTSRLFPPTHSGGAGAQNEAWGLGAASSGPDLAYPRASRSAYTLCYAIELPSRKSGFRAGFWPDSSRGNLKINPPAGLRPAGGPILRLSRLASGRNPARESDFRP